MSIPELHQRVTGRPSPFAFHTAYLQWDTLPKEPLALQPSTPPKTSSPIQHAALARALRCIGKIFCHTKRSLWRCLARCSFCCHRCSLCFEGGRGCIDGSRSCIEQRSARRFVWCGRTSFD